MLEIRNRYTVVIPDLFFYGGDNFTFSEDAEILSSPESSPVDVEVVSNYVKGKLLDVQLGERIKIVQD